MKRLLSELEMVNADAIGKYETINMEIEQITDGKGSIVNHIISKHSDKIVDVPEEEVKASAEK